MNLLLLRDTDVDVVHVQLVQAFHHDEVKRLPGNARLPDIPLARTTISIAASGLAALGSTATLMTSRAWLPGEAANVQGDAGQGGGRCRALLDARGFGRGHSRRPRASGRLPSSVLLRSSSTRVGSAP